MSCWRSSCSSRIAISVMKPLAVKACTQALSSESSGTSWLETLRITKARFIQSTPPLDPVGACCVVDHMRKRSVVWWTSHGHMATFEKAATPTPKTMSDDELDELETKLEDLTRQNDVLKQENELFDSYLGRQAEGLAGSDDDEKKDEKDKKNRQRRARAQVMLTMEQKNDISSTELEAAHKELEETKRTSERLIDTLRAVIEETDIRIAELKKDAYEFKRDIVVGAENFRTGKTIAEKMIRYMEEKLRQKDAVIEKLRLKNATLKSQAQKIDAQLRHKEEMGDALHYIDFHQLQIENKQYVAKIEERNEELLKLKQTTGNTVQVLNNLKKKLQELMEESTWLQNEIQSRTELNEKVIEEIAQIDDQNQKDSRKIHKLQTQQGAEPTKDMPQILDYVGQKAKMYELQQEIKNYERKVEIAERALKLHKSKLRRRAST